MLMLSDGCNAPSQIYFSVLHLMVSVSAVRKFVLKVMLMLISHYMASQGRKSDMCASVAASAANVLSKHCLPPPPTSNECGSSKQIISG